MILVLMMTLSACGEAPTSSQGRVAILDLQRIAKATGWDARMTEELGNAQQTWQQRLAEEGTQIDQEIRAKREEIGDEPTPEQIAQLQGRFREEVRPYARQAADALGFKIVMIRSDVLLSYDTGSDITDAVIAALLNAGKRYSGTPEAPDAPDAPDAPQAPVVPQVPESAAPEDAPQAPDASSSSEMPLVPLEPVAPAPPATAPQSP